MGAADGSAFGPGDSFRGGAAVAPSPRRPGGGAGAEGENAGATGGGGGTSGNGGGASGAGGGGGGGGAEGGGGGSGGGGGYAGGASGAAGGAAPGLAPGGSMFPSMEFGMMGAPFHRSLLRARPPRE